MISPRCYLDKVVKNGRIHNGKPKLKCKVYSRAFVEDLQNRPILDSTKEIIDKLWLARISLAGINRTMGVSEKWLYHYQAIKSACGYVKKRGKLTLQIDELWSFVNHKDNK